MLRVVEAGGAEKEAIRAELQRVLSSAGFSRNERQSSFLRFLVGRSVEGRDQELKESVIAFEVFGRSADYDPKLDAIVRTEAVRLRARLEKYYTAEGAADPLVIELPKGGYRPVFRERRSIPAERPKPRRVRLWLIGGAVAVILVVAAAIVWRMRAHPASVVVAVLPLENIGHDPSSDYLADGLTDEIISSLSLIDGLTVRSRTSTFSLKGKRISAAEAGKDLAADYLVEGSVLHAGDQLRVTAELVRARDDVPIWSNRFDRKLTDVFAIQDDIARGIVNSLRLKLSSGRRRYETNLDAYESYLRGRQAMESFPAPGRPIASAAIQHFERAIQQDANYALAYAGMADALLAIERNVGQSAAPNSLQRARDAAARAVELDPSLSEAQSALASIHARDYAWTDAERGYRRAIVLNPNNALAHLQLGFLLIVSQRRFDEGLTEVRRAASLDPLSPSVNTELGHALLLAGHYREAIDQLRKTIPLEPTRPRAYNLMGRALYLQGQATDALSVFATGIKLAGTTGVNSFACADVRAGRRDEALKILQTDLERPIIPSVRLALTYACLDDAEHALNYLDKMSVDHDAALPETLGAPELAWMRGNPRFAALWRQTGLAP